MDTRLINRLHLTHKIKIGIFYLASLAIENGVFQPNYQKLVIVTVGRTGSTMLIDCLNQHPEIKMYYEIFGHNAETDSPLWRKLLQKKPIRDLNLRVYQYHPPQVQIVGFKIHYYHCQAANQKTVGDYLANNVDKVIHLKRDLVETYVSGQLARKFKTWHVYDKNELSYMNQASIQIDPTELQAYLEEKTIERDNFDRKFTNRDVMDVWYKNLNDNLQEELLRIQVWLGLKPVEMRPSSYKQNTHRLDEIITNYPEVQSFFRDTQWAPSFRC